jgi:phage terminase small subunit
MSPKQILFVKEYLLDLNASKACLRAGYSHRNADTMGSQLLRKPQVAAAIAAAKAERSERTMIDAAWLLSHLAEEATADIADLYDDEGNIKPIRSWPKVWRTGLVAGFEVEELFEGRGADKRTIGRLRKVKLADRTRIKELIGKHVDVQAFKEKLEHDVSDSLAALITKSLAE